MTVLTRVATALPLGPADMLFARALVALSPHKTAHACTPDCLAPYYCGSCSCANGCVGRKYCDDCTGAKCYCDCSLPC